MAFPQPPDSKAAVRRAGQGVAEGDHSEDDVALIDQWRASHGYPLNTFQMSLRRRIEKIGGPVDFVQRLKRRNTVIDKLRRVKPDGSPLIGDVTSMNDFAGCRLIFWDVASLRRFRADMHKGFAEHQLINEPDKFDYIDAPKITGYRGVHDIYRHLPRKHRAEGEENPWAGLKVEIQYRTRVQNSWATAVELADLMDRERTKFGFGEGRRGPFFRLASEIIARRHEGIERTFLRYDTDRLRHLLDRLENRLRILDRLSALRAYDGGVRLAKHNVFNIVQDDVSESGFRLDISTFRSPSMALAAANAAESDEESINAVYVRADNPAQLRSAYKNYFSDPTNFVELIK